jgi:hypothetical protein
MTRVIVDKDTSSKLDQAVGRVQVCDASGRMLGYFTPLNRQSVYEGVECPVSNEELTRREREEPTYTTQQVLSHLEKLA